MWAFQFGIPTAAAMWGAHIGIGFATVITHSGFYVVVLLCVVADPALGAVLMMSYWVGRTLPIWLAPVVLTDYRSGGQATKELQHDSAFYRHLAATGLGLIALAVLVIARG